MSTKVPLQAVLHSAYNYGHEYEQIINELFDCIFGAMMEENTPYEEILDLDYHPFNRDKNVTDEQQICDKLNEFLKDSQQYLHLPIENEKIPLRQELLTPKTIVDLKPFALLIGWLFL